MKGLMMMAAALLAAFIAHHAGEPKQPLLIEATLSQPAPVDVTARAKFPASDSAVVDIVAAVNRAVNAAIKPVTDRAHYKVAERFVAWPADLQGDCEDYALSKMELLGNLGMPLPGNVILLSVVVRQTGGAADGHAILQLRLPSGAFAYLDNNFNEPMTRTELVARGYEFFDWSDR